MSRVSSRTKRILDWHVTLGLILIALTVLVYYVHFLVFRDLHHIAIFFVGDIAFVFFEVLLVTLVIYRLLHHREKQALRNKLNMLVGAFFSEVGTDLLRRFAAFDAAAYKITQSLAVPEDWSERAFLSIRESVEKHDSAMEGTTGDLEKVKSYLRGKKQFLLDLLQNPSLVENESFTNLVWAVFHLTEELAHRHDLKEPAHADFQHLLADIKRVYHLLIAQWMEYMKHLKSDHPHLFSLASRTNPFDASASVEVR